MVNRENARVPIEILQKFRCLIPILYTVRTARSLSTGNTEDTSPDASGLLCRRVHSLRNPYEKRCPRRELYTAPYILASELNYPIDCETNGYSNSRYNARSW